MEEITAYIALFLMLVFLIGLVILEVLGANIFDKLYSEPKKIMFWWKISWLKDNAERFSDEDKNKIRLIARVKKILLGIIIAIFIFYFFGNLAGL